MITKLDLSDIKNIIKIGKLLEVKIEANKDETIMYGHMRFGKEGMLYVTKTIEEKNESPGMIRIDSKAIKLLQGKEININNNMLICGDRIIYVDENANEFDVEVVDMTFNQCITLEFNEFKEASEIIYATDKSNIRPILHGLCLDEQYLVGLDGYALGKRKLSAKTDEKLIIPLHAIEAIRRIKVKDNKSNIHILANEEYIKFYIPEEGLILISNRIQGEYVNYRSLIPETFKTTVEVDAKTLYKIAKQYAAAGFKNMFFYFKDETTIHSRILGFKIKDKLSVDHNGDDLKIAIQSQYIIKALRNYKGKIVLNMNSDVSPIWVVQGDKGDLILPLRICGAEWERNYE